MNVREQINQAIRGEIRGALHASQVPLTASAIHSACPTAVDLEDTRPVLRALVHGKELAACAWQNKTAYCLPHKLPADAAPPPRPRQHISDEVAAALVAEQAWLTVAELEYRLRGVLEAAQIRSAVKSPMIQARDRAGSGLHEYGLAKWPNAQPAEPAAAKLGPPVKNGRGQRVMAVVTARDAWLSVPEVASALGEDETHVGKSLTYLAGPKSGRLAVRVEPAEGRKRYGLAAWAEAAEPAPAPEPATPARIGTRDSGLGEERDSEKTTPRPESRAFPESRVPDPESRIPPDAATAAAIAAPGLLTGAQRDQLFAPADTDKTPCFALWSDGRLSIETADGAMDLSPAACRALVDYLVGARGQIGRLFDHLEPLA